MGEITVGVQDVDHLLHDPPGTYHDAPYHPAYADLIEQAQAIRGGAPYELRVSVTSFRYIHGREDQC
ncbi:hypothetical protein [Streptomyces sp. NPDC001930]|uniref:hypothetical protein n=1 Tax=Streptomyces sp. NPDC001930 TaxID=3364625 RepID=UPI0036A727A7